MVGQEGRKCISDTLRARYAIKKSYRNVTDVHVDRFRESFRPPKIAAPSESRLYVHNGGADALLKLSEHGNVFNFSDLNIVDVLLVAEFQELIRSTIPQVITCLGESESAAITLAILSKQGKEGIKSSDLNIANVIVAAFRESIRPAIPKIIALLSNGKLNVYRVVDALSKLLVILSGQGKVSNLLT